VPNKKVLFEINSVPKTIRFIKISI